MSVRELNRFSLFIIAVILLAAGCSTSGSNDNQTPATSTVSGVIFAAPVAHSTVVVKDAAGATIAGPVFTKNDGTYSIDVPANALASDFRVESSMGTFADEASGTTTTAGILAAYVSGGTVTAGSVNIDPSTTIICDLVIKSGKTVGEAQTIFNKAFGYTPDMSVAPKNAPTSGSDTPQRLAGMRAVAFSQMTKDLGLTSDKQFALIDAIAEDLVDSNFDGKNASAAVSIGNATMPEDIQNRYERSLVSLMTNTTVNMTGLSADQIASLPFGKVALTNTYRVEYVPMGMMGAVQGKTMFKVKITRLSDGAAAPGLTVSIMPVMHMATTMHSSPIGNVVDNGDGTYTCTVYYLMASGMGMGYCELDVIIGGMTGETATFYPAVGMAMGTTTVRATLKGQSDIISSMTGTEKRAYYLFNDGLNGTTAFNLFIAAKDSMMSYPALSGGTALHDAANTLWTANPITVSASTDGINWNAAIDNAGGHWSVSGLSGLISGQTGTIYVKLNVNGEDKTSDGNAASGSNAYAKFIVTP